MKLHEDKCINIRTKSANSNIKSSKQQVLHNVHLTGIHSPETFKQNKIQRCVRGFVGHSFGCLRHLKTLTAFTNRICTQNTLLFLCLLPEHFLSKMHGNFIMRLIGYSYCSSGVNRSMWLWHKWRYKEDTAGYKWRYKKDKVKYKWRNWEDVVRVQVK